MILSSPVYDVFSVKLYVRVWAIYSNVIWDLVWMMVMEMLLFVWDWLFLSFWFLAAKIVTGRWFIVLPVKIVLANDLL